ncbi:hypothetical protein BD413DRAFT_517982, partial [Trametes elegans]
MGTVYRVQPVPRPLRLWDGVSCGRPGVRVVRIMYQVNDGAPALGRDAPRLVPRLKSTGTSISAREMRRTASGERCPASAVASEPSPLDVQVGIDAGLLTRLVRDMSTPVSRRPRCTQTASCVATERIGISQQRSSRCQALLRARDSVGRTMRAAWGGPERRVRMSTYVAPRAAHRAWVGPEDLLTCPRCPPAERRSGEVRAHGTHTIVRDV